MVSRSEGYRQSAGKEQPSLDILAAFARSEWDIQLTAITDAEENYRHGDFRLPWGSTIECKGQPIDPERYPQNFVEVFEVTSSTLHERGLERLAEIVGIPSRTLQSTRVYDVPRGQWTVVGAPPYVSVSLTSIAGASFTAYVNPAGGGRHLYLYQRDEILGHIRAALRGGLIRGAGQSNMDTFGMKIPLARWRYRRLETGRWHFVGPDSPPSRKDVELAS